MDLLGTLVGEFRIERQLGSGAMGEVYLAVHPVIGRQVAVKVLRAEIARDDSQVKRFIEEARAVTTIKHPAVVDVFGFGTLPDSRLYLVMDLLEGVSFSSYLKERAPLSSTEARQWLLELFEAVTAAHEAGVVHRDLKPSNLFLVGIRSQQRLKVLDFGIARRVDRQEQLTRPNVVLGSPAFMAPEQIRGEAGPSCDLYAIGCIAFLMLTGKHVFPAESVIDLLNHHLLTPAPSLREVVPSVPVALDEFVQRLLAKEPSNRPASAREAMALLERIDVGEDGERPEEQQAKTVVARAPEAPGPRTETMVPLGDRSLVTAPGVRTDTMPELAGRGTQTAPALVPGATRTAEALPVQRAPLAPERRVGWPYVAGGIIVVIVGALAFPLIQRPAQEPPVTVNATPVQPPVPEPKAPVRQEVVVAPVVEEPPPPAVVAAPSAPARPVRKQPQPTVGPADRLAKTPSLAELSSRLARNEAAVREGRVVGGKAAALLLEDARERFSASPSAADRIELQTFLDDWERRHLTR